MPAFHDSLFETFQAQFTRRWHHLNDPHVRDLAWLLDSPDLLDSNASQWRGMIATLSDRMNQAVRDWLAGLDRQPGALHAYLKIDAFTRLGRYAESLLAFYFQDQGLLLAHALQVRANKNDTVGEFDFLLRQGDALLHWEFATKLYLLESGGAGTEIDNFVGPNLADTLGAKMRIILGRQLLLGQHPAAQGHLPQAVGSAKALIKGWLFYYHQEPGPPQLAGLSADHCRGFWTTLEEFDRVPGDHFVVLPRLRWLAPAKLAPVQAIGRRALQQVLVQHFVRDAMPVLVAVLQPQGDTLVESNRGFIVPEGWRRLARERRERLLQP